MKNEATAAVDACVHDGRDKAAAEAQAGSEQRPAPLQRHERPYHCGTRWELAWGRWPERGGHTQPVDAEQD